MRMEIRGGKELAARTPDKRTVSCRSDDSEKLEVLSFLCLRYWQAADRRLFAIHGSEAPFGDIPVPKSWIVTESLKLPLFSIVTSAGNRSFIRLAEQGIPFCLFD